ncbi:MAG: iron-sulfur cluster assembly accessory protein [Azospirillum brasilense]|jgi:iron-sulfur cluster insertion protein|nr:MAG: iron-sulfur cluster assembly accessory protein [Azospirillum brasilense]PZR16306.1 MAG: iron-sulfur cluster assembly accessory protein [Azospirillum brasilense]
MTMPDGSQTPPPQPFRATPRAHRQIAEIAAREGRPQAGLRLAVEAGGCSGLQYKFELADEPEGEDTVVRAEDGQGAPVFIDPVSLDFLQGAELDWADALMGAHFAVRNPQAVSGCGCGVSFAVG